MERRPLVPFGLAVVASVGISLQISAKPAVAPAPAAPPADAPGSRLAKVDEGTAVSTDSEPVSPTSIAGPLQLSDDVAAVMKKRHPESVADLKLIQSQVRKVVDRVTSATVAVRVSGAFGSAVIVSSDGLVLTAGHVVGKPGQEVEFIFPDNSRAKGETLGLFREIDSGMMRITDPGPWPHVPMAKAGDVQVGQWVVAIGQPGGFDGTRTPPVRLGRVLIADDEVISTDCTLVGGDSGGPLLNMRGEVVGIHSRIGRRITENFHVPIATYHETRDRLIAGEEWGGPLDAASQVEARPLLGVAGDPRGEGCVLTQVFPNMPAERAGVKVGDTVRKFNGQKVDSFRQLVRMVYEQEPNATVKLQVMRDGEIKDFKIKLRAITRPLPGSPELPEE